MPHFILDCAESILKIHSEEAIMEQVHVIASATKLFDDADIKVRVNPYKKYLVGGKREDFIHVFAYIMEGRSAEQKADLSKKIVQKLTIMFPKVTRIAMNISDFDRATYFNRDLL